MTKAPLQNESVSGNPSEVFEDFEALWQAHTSDQAEACVQQMRDADADKASLARDWEDELRASLNRRSADDIAADEAGVKRWGEL